jgi:hypothetical protein
MKASPHWNAINVEKGCFNCRGCKAKGDVIALVQFFESACQKLTGGLLAEGPA